MSAINNNLSVTASVPCPAKGRKLRPLAPAASENAESYWERIASRTWSKYLAEVELRAISWAHNSFERPTRGLEIGCDGGRWVKMLADAGWQMTCSDINPQAIDRCRRRILLATSRLVDPADTTLPLEDDAADLLLCIETPPVIEAEWFLDESLRVLRPGGLMVGVFLNLTSWRGIAGYVAAKLTGGRLFYHQAYPRWRRELQRRGFRIRYEEGYCWMPFGRDSNSRAVPLMTALERLLRLRRLPTLSPWIVFVAEKQRTE